MTKLATGGCLAILLSAEVFGPMGFGYRYVDNLQHRVREQLHARRIRDVDVAIQQEPSLRRVIVLSGDVPARDRAEAISISQNIAGVASVRWSADGRGASSLAPGLSVRSR